MAQPNVLHSSLEFLHFGDPLIFIVYRSHLSYQDKLINFQAKINKQKYSFQKANIELFSTFEYIQTYSLHSKKVALRIIQIFNNSIQLNFLQLTPWIYGLFTSLRNQMYYIVVWNRDRSQNY